MWNFRAVKVSSIVPGTSTADVFLWGGEQEQVETGAGGGGACLQPLRKFTKYYTRLFPRVGRHLPAEAAM